MTDITQHREELERIGSIHYLDQFRGWSVVIVGRKSIMMTQSAGGWKASDKQLWDSGAFDYDDVETYGLGASPADAYAAYLRATVALAHRRADAAKAAASAAESALHGAVAHCAAELARIGAEAQS